MAEPVRMPPLGTTSDELRIVEWLRAVGDDVAAGEALLVVETDKATLEVEAAASGTLLAIRRQAGETVEAGTVVGYVGTAGEEPPAETRTGRVEASPAVRQLARERGVELASLTGTGPGGRIERADVLGAGVEAGQALSPHRQALARRLGRAVAVPQFSVGVTVDMTAVAAELDVPGVTYTHVLLRAMAATLRAHPDLNAVWQEGARLRRLERCDIGLAVADEDALYVVTIPEPDLLAPAELVEQVEQAAAEARAGRVSEPHGRRVALVLSNLGATGVDRFAAILDPDATAVLAAGRVTGRPAAAGDDVRVSPLLDLTLTVDHRVADGVVAGRFLVGLRDRLEAGDDR